MTMRDKLARAIAEGLGDDFDDAHESKAHWIETRGEGLVSKRFRDVNEPCKPDYLAAVDAILNVLCQPDGAMMAKLAPRPEHWPPAGENVVMDVAVIADRAQLASSIQAFIDTIINEGRG